MSRCYPFPPPGYVKSAPVELDLSSKKEKRKHKEKKKKRKKHSATNGDLTIKELCCGLLEDDQQCKYFEQSGQLNKGSSVGNDKLPSTTTSQGAIERLQTESFVDKVFSNPSIATDSEREQGLKPREELLSRSMLAAERLQADDSSRHVLSKGVNGINSCQSLQGVKSMMEGLTGSGLATVDKRSRFDSSTVLSNGVPVASRCKKPEQAESSVFSNGVLSTKRKRLQADISGDGLLPNNVLAADYKKSDGLQTGKPRPDLPTNSTIFQAENSGNLLISKTGLPSDCKRSGKRLRADHSRSKVGTNSACSTSSQAKIGNGGEVPYHLLANDGNLREERLKPYVQSNGVMASHCDKMQTNSSSVRQPLNGVMITDKCDESDKRMQPGKALLMNPIRDSSMNNSPANRVNQKMRSGSSMASKCERSEQRLQSTTNALPNGLSNAADKRLEANSTKLKVHSHDARAICEERSDIDGSRHDMRVSDVKTEADKTCKEQTNSRLKADGSKNRVLLNGVLAGHQEEPIQPSKVGINLSLSPRSAAVAAPSKATSTPKVQSDSEDKLIKEKLMKLRIPPPGQVWVTTEDEDWLVSCKQQLQPKQGEKGEEAEIKQVWAETVLLPAIGLHALPYVIPY